MALIPHTFDAFTNGFFETGNQVHDWVITRARQQVAADEQRRTSLRTAEDVRRYQAGLRTDFLEAIGGLPEGERGTAPPVVETGVLDRPGYRIHQLVFESLPGMPVTALLYRPTGLDGPLPGVLMLCGHSPAGKAAPHYQRVCLDLVQNGFVVLIVETFSHGEMLQCLDGDGIPLVGSNTNEHMHLQGPAWIINHNIARYFTWNAIRGLDLLCAQPVVDSARIGVTGNSGGGTQTQYLMLCDERPAAAFPGCSLSSRASYLETGVRAYDGEQNLFGCIPAGLDYADFIAACAPRPVCIGAAEYDFFCIEAVEQTYRQAKGIYALLGAEDRLDLAIAEQLPHGYSAPLRQACVNWFRRHLQGLPEDFVTDEPAVEDEGLLHCTTSGQVLQEEGQHRSMTAFIRDAWRDIRKKEAGAVTGEDIRRWLAIPDPSTPIRLRRNHHIEEYGLIGEHLFFFSEPGIIVTAICYRPVAEPKRATMLLLPNGTCGQESYREVIASLLAAGHLVYVPDLRGIGAVAMRSRNHAQGHAPRSVEFRIASDCFMLGTSQVALRTSDLLRHVANLRQRPEACCQQAIGLLASGGPAIYGLCAAAIDDAFGPCVFHRCLATWDGVFDGGVRDHDLFSVAFAAPEFAGRLDIPDLLRIASRDGSRTMALSQPLRPDGESDDSAALRRTVPLLLDPGHEALVAFLSQESQP